MGAVRVSLAAAAACVVAAGGVAVPCAEAPLVDGGVPLHKNPRALRATGPGKGIRAHIVGDFGVDLEANVEPGEWRKDFDVQRRNAVARKMQEASLQRHVDFAINTGDSFYQSGVRDTADPRWQTTWQNVFTAPDAYWYSVLGNHDWYGNEAAQDDAGTLSQIRYTVNNADNRWCMPDMNYTLDTRNEAGNVTMRFVFVDTQSLLPSETGGCGDARNLSNVDRTEDACKGRAVPTREAQLVWLESQVCGERTADWVAVVGHHPLVSAGGLLAGSDPRMTPAFIDSLGASEEVKAVLRAKYAYNPSQLYRQRGMEPVLLDMLMRCKVDLYISGHEHLTQVLTHTTLGHQLSMVTYGDSGKANLIQQLQREPDASACRITGQCFASPTTVKKAWGAAWDLVFKDHNGAFGELYATKESIAIETINTNGLAINTHMVYKDNDRIARTPPEQRVEPVAAQKAHDHTGSLFLTGILVVLAVVTALNSSPMRVGQ